MKRVGFVGWRGMVGSVLLERMRAEGDFAEIEPEFFSTSQAGGRGPDVGRDVPMLRDAFDIDALSALDIVVVLRIIQGRLGVRIEQAQSHQARADISDCDAGVPAAEDGHLSPTAGRAAGRQGGQPWALRR